MGSFVYAFNNSYQVYDMGDWDNIITPVIFTEIYQSSRPGFGVHIEKNNRRITVEDYPNQPPQKNIRWARRFWVKASVWHCVNHPHLEDYMGLGSNTVLELSTNPYSYSPPYKISSAASEFMIFRLGSTKKGGSRFIEKWQEAGAYAQEQLSVQAVLTLRPDDYGYPTGIDLVLKASANKREEWPWNKYYIVRCARLFMHELVPYLDLHVPGEAPFPSVDIDDVQALCGTSLRAEVIDRALTLAYKITNSYLYRADLSHSVMYSITNYLAAHYITLQEEAIDQNEHKTPPSVFGGENPEGRKLDKTSWGQEAMKLDTTGALKEANCNDGEF